MLFVDNEGTKFSLLRGPSDNTVVDFLAEKMVELEASVHAFTWLARVPSSCSVADAPSGGRINGELLRNGVDEFGKDGRTPIPLAKRKCPHRAS